MITEERIAIVRAGFAAQTPLAAMGATLDMIEEGQVTIVLPITDGVVTLGTRVVTGGVIAAVADVAAGLSLLTLMASPRPVITVEIAAHLLAPARGEALICVGRAEKIGKRHCVGGADVFVEENAQRRKVAILTATFMVME